jgi:hypothetical protein
LRPVARLWLVVTRVRTCANDAQESLVEVDEKLRMLRLEIAELERELSVTKKILPTMPHLAEKILDLQKLLAVEKKVREEECSAVQCRAVECQSVGLRPCARPGLGVVVQKTEKLCRDLESPENADRWRALVGEDPDEDQLAAKIHVLEERLSDKKEQLLEKDLVLEEVTALCDKLRRQASEDKAGTEQLALQLSSYQGRIRETTRKMMAIVSELSMYQATSMKLSQEHAEREMVLKDATARFDAGEAPTTEAVTLWRRAERSKLLAAEATMAAMQRSRDASLPEQVTRTTAEPRPNAYIPEDVGLPQPYGKLAPFKPAEAGSTMRHFRKPEPKDIEI